ncbi:hypothetical protein O6H91_23G005800 [Diphasiastrum complanatum]|uniref:Uncharacterized protein n=2 Tax=Diphasiastrum complanatum TaxID=34168 RepID=A0ACC2A9I5_DIPCM|nr:hypothetical protein O6H91_23G005800 [Diphasiastrum complanatum]
MAMDQSTSSGASIFFSGPIPIAIATAQRESKILLVYIGGDDVESKKLEETTWRDFKLLDEVHQSTIALQLRGASPDADHFSALYPVRAVPSITFIGCNGSMLWQHGGYVNAEELLQQLQEAREAMKVMNSAAGAIFAALSSAGRSNDMSSVPSSSLVKEETISQNSESPKPKDGLDSNSRTAPLKEPVTSKSNTENVSDSDLPAYVNVELSGVDVSVEASDLKSDVRKGKASVLSVPDALSNESSSRLSNICMSMEGDEATKLQSEKADACKNNLNALRDIVDEFEHMKAKLEDVLLQIRLTNGQVIRGQFKSADCLKAVMDFVDQNGTEMGNYSLAIPFPRKVFTTEEYSKTLFDLRLESRAALIVVPVNNMEKKLGPAFLVSSSTTTTANSMPVEQSTSSSFLGRALSYLNPFSYLSWAFPERQTSPGSSTWQYDPNPTYGRVIRGDIPAAPEQDDNLANLNNARLPRQHSSTTTQRRGWGAQGNVHTLNHNEEDMFRKGNTYWNGNSTQFGGEDDSKR